MIGISFISCNNKVKEIDLKLEKLTPGTTFKLDTININDWDYLYIVRPYETIDSGKYNMPESVLNKINNTARYDDGSCTLLFIKNNQLINYSIVQRNIIDFILLEPDTKYTFPFSQEYKLDIKRVVTIP